jgi:putative ABC transport system permease protein
MKDVLYLAWRYIAYHRIKTGILIASIMLIVYLPVGLNVLVDQSAEQLTARAGATPLLVGARGSPLELALNSLYFESDTPALTRYAEAERIGAWGLATPIPLYVRFRSRGHPIVGTTLDYFEFRGLSLAQGRMMATLGEAVIGARVARSLRLEAGDTVVSSPETVFDLAGVYPLKMKIAGVLAPNFSPDDEAIFVDIKTAWVMEGLGHGHQELASPEASSAVLSREGNRIVANASVIQYNEITAENIDSFHFHGDNADFPLSAVVPVPVDKKSGVLLMGRYQGGSEASQIIEPLSVIEELLGTVVSIQQFVVAAVIIVSLATVATAALVFMLSLRLRRREIDTMFKIGASRSRVTGTLASEVIVVLALAILLAAVMTALTSQYGTDIIDNLILS